MSDHIEPAPAEPLYDEAGGEAGWVIAGLQKRVAEQAAEALKKQAAEIAGLREDMDPPVCRLQFPDGSVPANAREAAEGWKRCYNALSAEVAALQQKSDAQLAIVVERDREIADLKANCTRLCEKLEQRDAELATMRDRSDVLWDSVEAALTKAGIVLADKAGYHTSLAGGVRDLTAERDALKARCVELEGLVHNCPKCGESCKQCSCWEKEHDALTAERDRLREVLCEIIAGVACENAGLLHNEYTYFWEKDWQRLKAKAAAALAGKERGE